MSTELKEKSKKIVAQNLLTGKWEISTTTKGTMGKMAFGGRMLTHYPHPISGETVHLKDVNGQIKPGYFIEKLTQVLRPDENPQDRLALQWLIAHPEVTVEGAQIDRSIKKSKANTVILRNIDNQTLDQIEEEDFIDKILGRLSIDSGPQAIGLKRLRILLAHFNLSYFEKRYLNNPEVEKKLLRKRLKAFCRVKGSDGRFNAYHVHEIIDEIDNYEIDYLFKQMVRTNLIKFHNSMYHYNNTPIGTTDASCVQFFKDFPNIYSEIQQKLFPILKEEGFN